MTQHKFAYNNQWTAANMTIEERFWSKVDKTGDCWLWLACLTPAGYGSFWLDGRNQMAHRIAYEMTVDLIAPGLHIDHLCRVPACVNPAHLEPVTPQENTRRGVGPASRTHCPAGHPYDKTNTLYIRTPHGTGIGRQCRTCNRRRTQAWRAKVKASAS